MVTYVDWASIFCLEYFDWSGKANQRHSPRSGLHSRTGTSVGGDVTVTSHAFFPSLIITPTKTKSKEFNVNGSVTRRKLAKEGRMFSACSTITDNYFFFLCRSDESSFWDFCRDGHFTSRTDFDTRSPHYFRELYVMRHNSGGDCSPRVTLIC